MHAGVGGGEGVVGGQSRRLTVAAAEVDRAGVAGDRLVAGVLRRDGDAERGAGRGRGGGGGEAQVGGGRVAGLTVTVAEPVIVEVTVSVAVTVWLPAVFRVRPVKVCTPAAAVKV